MGSPANHRKKPYPEIARSNISLGKLLASIERVSTRLEAGEVPPADVPGLRLLCENHFRLIAKVLPDLKSIEVSGNEGPLVVKLVRFAPE